MIGYIILCLLSSLPTVWIIPSLGTQHRLETVLRMKKTAEKTKTLVDNPYSGELALK